jgi:hypothetical protein
MKKRFIIDNQVAKQNKESQRTVRKGLKETTNQYFFDRFKISNRNAQ